MSQDKIFIIFVGVSGLWALAGFVIFFLRKDAKLKRKLWPPFLIGASIVFILFTYLMGYGKQVLYIAVPGVIVMTLLEIWSTKFCDVCAKITMSQNPLVKPEICSKCGERLP